MIQIETGVPAPSSRAGYPFAAMGVNDSFMMPAATDEEAKKIGTSIGASARNYARKHDGVKFTVRRVDGGVRCWRTA